MNVLDRIASFSYKRDTGLFNLSGGFFVLVVKKMFENIKRPILIVTANMLEARNLYNKFYDANVILFEDDDISFLFTDAELESGIDRPDTKDNAIDVLKKFSPEEIEKLFG